LTSGLSLLDSIYAVLDIQRTEELAGRRVGLRAWGNTLHLLRDSGQFALAGEALHFIKEHVDDVYKYELAHERALIDLRAGLVDDAVKKFERAYRLSGQESELWRAREALRSVGAERRLDYLGSTTVGLGQIGDLIAMHGEYLLAMEQVGGRLERSGRHSEAAAMLAATLLFEDRRAERTQILLRLAYLHRSAGELDSALECLVEAFDHVCARPSYSDVATATLRTALPARIAVQMCEIHKQRGLKAAEILERASDLPRFDSTLVTQSHFRIGLFIGVRRFDLLLREADAQLARRKGGRLARLARIEGLTGLGRSREATEAQKMLDAVSGRDGDTRKN
jgi:tetratricopeptide (TPR) repeat protein